MIDKNDVLTVDAFALPRRGRPRTGKALTPNERKANQRRKAFEALLDHPENINFSKLSVSALIERLPNAIKGGRTDIVDGITKRLKSIAEEKRTKNAEDKRKKFAEEKRKFAELAKEKKNNSKVKPKCLLSNKV